MFKERKRERADAANADHELFHSANYYTDTILPVPFMTSASFNPLSPHDALKHHFTSLKTQLISLQLGVLGGKLT